MLRADEPRPSLDRDEVLAAAPAVEDHRFRVPRIGGRHHDGRSGAWPPTSAPANARPARSVDEALAAVAAGDGEIHAFLSLLPDEARAAADAVDATVAAGNDPGPLAGVPVALKDNLCTRGAVTTCGSQILGGLAPALRRHRGRGAAPRRRHRAGQDEHGRVRHGQLDGELGLRADAQPAPTPARFRVAAAVVPPPPWRPGSLRSASARTPAAPSASRLPCAGWSG